MCSGADFVEEVSRIMCTRCQYQDECEELGEDGLDVLAACISAMKGELAELVGSTSIAQYAS